MSVQIFVWVPDITSLGYMPRTEISPSYSNPKFNFLGIATIFFTVAAPFYIPTRNTWGLQFLHILNLFKNNNLIGVNNLTDYWLNEMNEN